MSVMDFIAQQMFWKFTDRRGIRPPEPGPVQEIMPEAPTLATEPALPPVEPATGATLTTEGVALGPAPQASVISVASVAPRETEHQAAVAKLDQKVAETRRRRREKAERVVRIAAKPSPPPFTLEPREALARAVLPRSDIDRLAKVSACFRGFRPTKPVLRCGLLVSNSGQVTFYRTTFDESVMLDLVVPENGNGHGHMLIPSEAVKALADSRGEIYDVAVINGGELSVHVYQDRQIAGMLSFPADDPQDYPEPRHVDPAHAVPCPGLLAAIGEARTFRALERSRYAMNGVLLDLEHGAVVATDGKRMHAIPFPFDPVLQAGAKQLLLRSELALGSVFPIGQELASFDPDRGIFAVHVPGIGSWSTRQLEGQPPPYRAILDGRRAGVTWQLRPGEREDLARRLRGFVFARGAATVRITIMPDGTLRFAKKDELGRQEFAIPAELQPGPPGREQTVGVFQPYLVDILEHPRLRTITFTAPIGSAQIVIEGDGFTHLLMPVSLPA